jgi:hypothetical protein
MSSGRSIFVGETVSAASRVWMRTSATLMPGTLLSPPSTRAIHSPRPSNAPSLGSVPVPSISLWGLSPVNRAT